MRRRLNDKLPAARLLTALLLLAVVVCAMLAGCSEEPTSARKPQVVRLLPDTPPPPPPPPLQERQPSKPDEKPAPADPTPVDTPQAQALKTDEAPGDGQGSGLSSGTVTRDYAGQTIGGGGGGASVSTRLAALTYANGAQRELSEFLQADRQLRLHDYRLQVHLWLDDAGRIRRSELVGSSGQADVDEALRDALKRFPGTRVPPPEGLPQPVRLQLSNRMIG